MARAAARVAMAAQLVAAIAWAGCSIPADTPVPIPTQPEPVPVSSTRHDGAETEAVLAAYMGYWDTWLAAHDPPDPDHPGLERYYVGASLERARSTISENLARGVAFERSPADLAHHDASVRFIEADRAVVDDCSIDDGLVVAPDGAVLDDRVVSRRSEATLLFDGSWKVEDVVVVASFDGVAGCDAF